MVANPEWIKRYKISPENEKKINELHIKVDNLLKEMKSIEDDSQLRDKYKEYTEMNYSLQELWGFRKDIRKHPWEVLPNCTCPVFDNRDYRRLTVISLDCIYHGHETEYMELVTKE